ncbi:alpha/beta fold hydrolase [Vibrio salinus]|uniref:alpha/beta fold hydrolase n=1 Tax=Vibrio salinus TaxID=2899784 RepID=UPI001E600252|nr:alpha/beta hydrolase [Vibrio salinus]MCE0494193.1 alpha/beta hydrolase [Vibrio salinus]
MPFVTIEDRTMHYLDIGQGETLIFGHSFLWNAGMWRPQIELLSQKYRCIVPDFWAHGQSEFPPSSMQNLTDYAGHILQLADELNIESFSIVGLSVGGMWGAELTALAPERVKTLILADTFVGLEPEVNHDKYFAMLNTIIANQSFPSVVQEQMLPMFFAPRSLDGNAGYVQDFRQYISNVSGDAALQIASVGKMIYSRRDLFDDIEKFALPVLIMVGAEDRFHPVLESYLMHDSITGSELVIVPNAGHISNLEQTQFFNQALSDFLFRTLHK